MSPRRLLIVPVLPFICLTLLSISFTVFPARASPTVPSPTVPSTNVPSTNVPSTNVPSLLRQQPNEVSIAYFLQISESTMTLLPRLLKVLYHPQNTYIVHFDKKIPKWQRIHAASFLFKADPRYVPNVHILPAEPITYRGITMVLNTLNAIQLALDSSPSWTYFINISGSDYPLLSPTMQRRLLASHDFASRNRSFLSISPKSWWKESKKYRYMRLFTDTALSFNDSEHRIVDSFTDQPISFVHDFIFVAAEAWMTLHRSYAQILLKSSYARRMLISFSYALEPEEHFFATVAYNMPQVNQSVVPHALRHVEWVHNGKHAGQHPYYVDIPTEDGTSWSFRQKIENSGCFFTRKIRSKDSKFLDFLDKHINGIAHDFHKGNVKAYLDRTKEKLACLAGLNSGDYADVCFHNDEEVTDSALER